MNFLVFIFLSRRCRCHHHRCLDIDKHNECQILCTPEHIRILLALVHVIAKKWWLYSLRSFFRVFFSAEGGRACTYVCCCCCVFLFSLLSIFFSLFPAFDSISIKWKRKCCCFIVEAYAWKFFLLSGILFCLFFISSSLSSRLLLLPWVRLHWYTANSWCWLNKFQ